MYKILQNNITQLNTGDLEGKIFNSFNLDLTFNKGKIGIAPRTILTTGDDPLTTSNMTVPVSFKFFDGKWFFIGGRMFVNSGTAVANFVEDSSTGVPTACSSDYSDIEIFEDVLLVAGSSTLYTKASNGSGTGAYTSQRTFGSSSIPHPLCAYNRRGYWLDNNSPARIFSMGSDLSLATSGTYTLALPKEFNVLWMVPHASGIYVGTINRNGGEALVFDWDGVTVNKWNAAYTVGANGALAGYIDGQVLYVVNTRGELAYLNGSRFQTVARLPIKRDLLYQATNATTNDRFIHPRGLTKIDGHISMLINSRNNSTSSVTYQPNIHAGIWEYVPSATGGMGTLYHKHSMSYRTRPDAGGSITDYGQMTLSRVGALADVPDLFGTTDALKGNFLAGGQYFTNASSTAYGVWTDSYYDTVEKAGFFTTVQLKPSHVKDFWNRFTTLYSPSAGNSFVTKYRTSKEDHVDFSITWVDANTFTTTQSGLEAGDEVTIIQGTGSGRVAHITGTPTFSSPNYTVNLDETITGVTTGTAKARKENWRKISSITSTSRNFDEAPISDPDTWIEIKVAMLGTGDDVYVEEAVLDNAKNQ